MHRAVRLIGLAFLIFASNAALSGRAESATEPSTLLVQIVSPAKSIGFPAVCPGTSAEENQQDILCMAELYEARVKVLRHLGGAPTERILTMRFTAHSFHAAWKRSVRFILVASPFDDKGARGHFASYWDWEDDMGQFCIDQNAAAKQDWEPLKRLYARGTKRVIRIENDQWSKGSAIVCVSGTERLAD